MTIRLGLPGRITAAAGVGLFLGFILHIGEDGGGIFRGWLRQISRRHLYELPRYFD